MNAMNSYERLTINAALTLVGLSFVLAAVFIPSLPDQVAVHFDGSGRPDRVGSRYELIALPILQSIVVGIFWAIRFTHPDFYNFPPARNAEHRARMVQNTRSMMATLSLVVSAFMTWLGYSLLRVGQGGLMGSAWLPVSLLLIGVLATGALFSYRTHQMR